MSVQSQVADHYNRIANRSRVDRESSAIIGLKRYNNWVKSCLIHRYAAPNAVVLDLCGGKGGDLAKFKKANVRYLVLVDHAISSVRDAVQRYNEQDRIMFPASFICADCHSVELGPALPPNCEFDLVSCQFALHYSFETEARARMFVRNIAAQLKPGGVFIATFPNADVLQTKLKVALEAQRARIAQRRATDANYNPPLRLEFGNNFYTVKFTTPCPLVEQPSSAAAGSSSAAATAASSSPSGLSLPPLPPLPASPFGVQYSFDLVDAISDCPEYLVHLPTLQSLLLEYDLELIYSSTDLHRFFLDYHAHEEYGRLLKQLKVLGSSSDPNAHDRPLSPQEWEAIGVYMAVAFRRRMPGEIPGSFVECAVQSVAPALASVHKAPPPATPWINQRAHAEMQPNPFPKVAVKDIKILHPPPTAPANATASATSSSSSAAAMVMS